MLFGSSATSHGNSLAAVSKLSSFERFEHPLKRNGRRSMNLGR